MIGEGYVDAFLCGLQSALAQAKALRFCALSMWLGMGRSRAIAKRRPKGGVVAKIIEFYIPSNFRKSEKWIPAQSRGKVIAFGLQTKKSA